MKIVDKAVQLLKDINNSKGAHDLTGFVAHGATELANVAVHGHAAPMYSHGASPQGSVYGQEDFDQHNQDAEQRDGEHNKAQAALQLLKSRMETPEQHQDQEMSR